MPTITAFPDPTRAHVRVEINWSDLPQVTQAGVARYNTVTGECVPLRPHICFDGWEQELSCGHAIFFDTEAPFDTEFYYITTSTQAPCPPDPTLQIQDLYTRVLVDTWGTPTVGPAYSVYQGLIAQYDVNGTRGTITPGVIGTNTYALLDCDLTNYTAQIDLPVATIPTGGTIGAYGLVVRWVDDLNYFRIGISGTTADVVNVFITQVLAGVATATSVVIPISFGNINTLKVQVESGFLRVKAWRVGFAEPTAWQIEQANTLFNTSSMVGAIARRDAGNLTPTVLTFDNFTITENCLPCIPVTEDTSDDPTTLPSNGMFWLRDPVRPCNDRPVPLCFTQANTAIDPVTGNYCLPGSGIFFASMDTEVYASNTLTQNPTNAKYPIAMSRTRRGVSSLLTLVTRTFADRDALLALTDPGSPLFWQGPAAYGIPDQYMDIGDLSIERGLSDHKFQVRVVNLPYLAVARPAGPSQGVCGSQVQDLCDFTWGELEADGNTWEDLVRGRPTGGVSGYRTWTVGTNTVLADFADWNAVDDGVRTWTDLEVGL